MLIMSSGNLSANVLSRQWFPDTSKRGMDFLGSSFFKVQGSKLPNPLLVDKSRRGVATFSELNLLIKYGPDVTVDEAVTMWAIRQRLGHQIPIPELFGWRVHGNKVFIYMELINGTTLKESWGDMTLTDKKSICDQIREMLSTLRQLRQDETFIGSITRGPLLDRVFYRFPRTGPFNTLHKFYDELELLPRQHLKPHQRYKDPYLERLPHDSSITFTHADVHPSNIMVTSSRSGSPRVLALIDWGQAGWYPDYWEYCKMCYTTHWEDEWRKIWFPEMIRPRQDEQYFFAEYTNCIGGI